MIEQDDSGGPHLADQGTSPTDADDTPLHHPLEEHADRFVAHLFDDDFEQISREMFEPDFVREDRSTLSFPTTDLAGFVAASRSLRGTASPRIRRGPILAVRENCYLGSSTTSYQGGSENTRLVILVAGPTGRIARLITFDIDDLPAAEVELDRQASKAVG